MPKVASDNESPTSYTSVPTSARLKTRSMDESAASAIESIDKATPFGRRIGEHWLAQTHVRAAYVPVLLDVFDRLALEQGAEEQAVYGHLYRLALGDERNCCRVSRKDLSARTNLSDRRLGKALAGLVTKKHVALVERDRMGTLYRVFLPHEVFGEATPDAVLSVRESSSGRAKVVHTGHWAAESREIPASARSVSARAAPTRAASTRAGEGPGHSESARSEKVPLLTAPKEDVAPAKRGRVSEPVERVQGAQRRPQSAPPRGVPEVPPARENAISASTGSQSSSKGVDKDRVSKSMSVGARTLGTVAAKFLADTQQRYSRSEVVEEILGRMEEGRTLDAIEKELARFADNAPKRTPLRELSRFLERDR